MDSHCLKSLRGTRLVLSANGACADETHSHAPAILDNASRGGFMDSTINLATLLASALVLLSNSLP